MKLFEKLRLKLNTELALNIPEGANFKRTYAGYWQLANGAMKWIYWYPSLNYEIGSAFTVKEILKAKKISLWDNDLGRIYEIFPEDA